MNKKPLTIALLLVLPFLLTACTFTLPKISFFGSKKTASTGPVTLTMWGLWESPDVMTTIISKYKETHPNVTINYDDRSVLKLEDYKAAVYTRSTQPDTPDIVIVHNTWVPGLKDSLSPAPKDVISAQTYSQRFYDVAVKSAVLDNNVYALPIYYDGLVLVYNKSQFAEIDQKDPPTAWEEFRRLALALTVRGSNGSLVRAGAAIGAADNIDFAPDILGLMLSQAKVTIPDDLDTKQAQDALTFYTNFVKEDDVWDKTFPEASLAFVNEKVSMIFVPTWNLLDIIKARPDLDIGVAPVPQALPNDPVSWASFWMAAVPAGGKNQAAAWDFIKFLTDNDQQLTLFSENSKVAPYGSAYSAMELKSQLDGNPYLKPLLDTATFATSARIAARSGNAAAVQAIDDAINASLTGGNAADIMKTAKSKIINTK